jgi:hypothetical protein
MFIVEFEYEWDKSRIMEGRLWPNSHTAGQTQLLLCGFLDPNVQLPLACMGKVTGEKIGSSVGNVKWMCMTEKRDGVNIYGQK